VHEEVEGVSWLKVNGSSPCWRLWCRWNIDIRNYVVDKCCK
jgi:hypothetical protein